jgi:beta-lactamase class A
MANEHLTQEIKRIEQDSGIKLGISAIHLESGDSFDYNGNARFSMASTVKLPIAIYFLKLEEQHKISLNKMIEIKQNDLIPGSGKIGYFLTKEGLAISNYNLLEPMITVSDNTATDIILRQIGGPKEVRKFLKQSNIEDIFLDRYIIELYIDSSGIDVLPPRKDWSLKKLNELFATANTDKKHQAELQFLNDYRDTTTPEAMRRLMVKLLKNELLSFKNTLLLKEILSRTENCKINSLLSPQIKTGNKTGTWWNNSNKKYITSNDVAYIILPDNAGTLVIAAYSSSINGNKVEKHEEAIAKASKTIYDYFYLLK